MALFKSKPKTVKAAPPPKAATAPPPPAAPTKKPDKPLEDCVGALGNYTFAWMQPLISKALKTKNLTPSDLHPAHPRMKAEYCGTEFARAWNKKRWNLMKKGRDEEPSIMPTIFSAFIGKGKNWLWSLPFYYVASIIAPITILYIIRVI